jgi:hypothetical protein
MADNPITAVAERLIRRYDAHLAALMAYGSRAYGTARTGSAYDFWLIVRDPEAFHRSNAEFYRTQLNVASTAEEQIELNRTGPIFYSLFLDGAEIKLAVMGEQQFTEFCRMDWWTVKGRMQKPLLAFRSSPIVDEAILAARREALACAISLLPPGFSVDQLLHEIAGLSYRAEVRPENKTAKIHSIVEAGRAELERIYQPLLAELSYVERHGDRCIDRRTEAERKKARKATLRSLRRSKWSRRSIRYIWRNYRSHGRPVRYILMKMFGEVEKTLRRRDRK